MSAAITMGTPINAREMRQRKLQKNAAKNMMNGDIDSVVPAMRGSKWSPIKNWMTFKKTKAAIASFYRMCFQGHGIARE